MAKRKNKRIPGNARHALGNQQFWDSAVDNLENYYLYYDRLVELAISTFEWVNLPESCDERFLELGLYGTGMMLFFRDEDMDEYLTLNCTLSGQFDVYNVPVVRMAYATNGYQNYKDKSNSVVIWNNMLRTIPLYAIRQFAKDLAFIDRVRDININAQKTPIAILCDEEQRLTMKNLYMKYDGNVPFIFGNKTINLNDIKAIQTGAPFLADKLYDIKVRIWNEALTYLGIANVSIQKKERVNTDEVNRSMGGTLASRFSRLNARRQACKEINRMFDLDVDCIFRKEIDEMANMPGSIGMREGEDVD